MPKSSYQVTYFHKRGKIGQFDLRSNELVSPHHITPKLFPVSTDVVAGDIENLDDPRPNPQALPYIWQNFPLLVQALIFLDGASQEKTKFWRRDGIRKAYQNIGISYYDAPIMLDSGGYRISQKKNLANFERYGLYADRLRENVLEFELDLKGELIMSFDYPVFDALRRTEAVERIDMSLRNAVDTAIDLSEMKSPPFYYACVQGQYPSDFKNYVERLFDEMGDVLPSFGLAFAVKGRQKVFMLEAVSQGWQGIPDAKKYTTPIHVLGVSGTIMPILAVFGVDTFDSLTHHKAATARLYHHPKSKPSHMLEVDVENLTCQCYNCRHPTIMKEIYERTANHGAVLGQPLCGRLGCHNAYMFMDWVKQGADSIRSDCSAEFMRDHIKRQGISWKIEEWIKENSSEYSKLASGNLKLFSDLSMSLKVSRGREVTHEVSLKYTEDAFSVSRDYAPPSEKKALLVMPNVKTRPYTKSHLYQNVFGRLSKDLPDWNQSIHVVSFDSLYGPVPVEFEGNPEVMQQAYRITSKDRQQINLIKGRLIAYLRQCGGKYEGMFAYCTGGFGSGLPRQIFKAVQKKVPKFELVPKEREFNQISGTDPKNLDILVSVLREYVNVETQQMTFM